MRKFILFMAFVLSVGVINANNVQISNVNIINNGSTLRIRFDISWENSWRVNTGQNNYDGVWVFFKYKKPGTSRWDHLYLNGQNNTAPAGATVYQLAPSFIPGFPASCMGAMIHRTTPGIGNVSFTGIELGINAGLAYDIDVKGFAIEMVYIPVPATNNNAIAFFVGDGDNINTSRNAFSTADLKNATFIPNNPLSTPGVIVSSTVLGLDNQDDEYIKHTPSNTPYLLLKNEGWMINGVERNDYWPTGQDCWVMKYELSSSAYCDFLNTLPVSVQPHHTLGTIAPPTSPAGTRALTNNPNEKNVVVIKTPSLNGQPAVYGCNGNGNSVIDEPGDGQWVACSHLTYLDLAAYMDWAGLSLMTEVIYERICRGHTSADVTLPIYGEYAWGNNQITNGLFTLNNMNTAQEAIGNQALSVSAGYANYGGGNTGTSPNVPFVNGMPLRNGVFAAFPGSNRITSGASFFGVMELSGNVQEICVSLGNADGRQFRGWHGDGGINHLGQADVSYWPTVNGAILRGGSFKDASEALRISDRGQGVAPFDPNDRRATVGGRGALYRY